MKRHAQRHHRDHHWLTRRRERARRQRSYQRWQTLRMITSLVAVKILVAPIISDVIGNCLYDGLGVILRWLQR